MAKEWIILIQDVVDGHYTQSKYILPVIRTICIIYKAAATKETLELFYTGLYDIFYQSRYIPRYNDKCIKKSTFVFSPLNTNLYGGLVGIFCYEFL